jgi:uncharacterized membrane protein
MASSTGARTNSNRASAVKKKQISNRNQTPFFISTVAALYVFLRFNAFGRFLLIVFITSLIVGMQMLMLNGHSILFFRLIGLEWLSLLGVCWVYFMTKGLPQ